MKQYLITIDGADKRAADLTDWLIEIVADGLRLDDEAEETVTVKEIN